MYEMIIAGVPLLYLPAAESVTVSGGGRPIAERTTIDGRVLSFRVPLPVPQRITVASPENYAIAQADADRIRALFGSDGFSVTLLGYERPGTYGGCVFENPPSFPPYGDTGLCAYNFEIYVPQGGI